MKKIDKFIENKIDSCLGKTFVITGANSGLGYETTRVLAYKGAQVIMACRSFERANKAKTKILDDYPDAKIDIMLFDQSSLSSIKNFIEELKQKYAKIDALICNAGIYHPELGQVTKDNFPLTIGTNYLGLFYLIENAKDYLKDTKIILVTSIAHRFKDYQDYNFLKEENYSSFKQYCISKLCIARYFEYLKKHTDLHVYLMHPGVSNTNLFSSNTSSYKKWFKKLANKLLPLFVHSPKKAALSLSLLAANEYENHTFLGPRGLGQISGYPKVVKLKKRGKKDADNLFQETLKVLKERE